MTARVERVLEALEQHVGLLTKKVRGAVLREIAEQLAARGARPGRSETELLVALVMQMRGLAEEKVAELTALDQHWRDFEQRLLRIPRDGQRPRVTDPGAPASGPQRQVLEDYLRASVVDPAQRAADRSALDRFLDHDALRERHAIARHRILVVLEVLVTFVGRAAASAIDHAGSRARKAREFFDDARITELLHDVAENGTRWQLRRAAIEGLIRCAEVAREQDLDWHAELAQKHLGLAVRFATNVDEHAWVQGRALRLALALSFDLGVDLMARRLLEPSSAPHDFLVRRLCVDLLGASLDVRTLALLRDVAGRRDPSVHVRQGVAEALARRGELTGLHKLAGLDRADPEPSPKVRGVAVQAACAAATTPDAAAVATGFVIGMLASETAALPLTIACEDITDVVARLPPERGLAELLLTGLLELARRSDRPAGVREAAAAAAERVALTLDRDFRSWKQFLARFVATIPPGSSRTVSLAEIRDLPELPADPAFLGRILAALSRTDFPLFATRTSSRLQLWRGDRYRRRLWRVLHEAARPAPNKRQGFGHTRGRTMRGSLRAPPGNLDEHTATVVPGERVFVAEEGGWGRHLPTVDDVLDLPVWSGDEVRVFSSFGITTLRAPDSRVKRVRNRLRLSRSYAKLAALRVQSLQGTEPHARQRYVDALRDYGITISFAPYAYPNHRESAVGERIASLFSRQDPAPAKRTGLVAAAAFPPSLPEVTDWLERQGSYFATLQGNGQLALALFLVGFALLFFIGAYRKRARIDRARKQIPLTIGGWGTRGKSGTERLKAAVFHGLGYEVAVKTTGCEAMLIHSVPDEAPHEIFIFRSYDKATIWEQRDTLETAAALGSEVFLWECMALQPEFVELLQKDWMRDDLVTLTNAFPDHEDVQGPTGADVAECISKFIPHDSTLITSEVNFLPVFAEQCKQRGTTLCVTTPRSAELIADDLLALFPYAEHPRNIALVADLAEQLGIDRHLAIATMAEHVVPDLGVLKAYPTACVRGRALRFSNGMSANERTGFLNNWERMGFGTKDVEDPREAVVTVVNNRWDRVARSEVFARIMVEDCVVDAHVIIGTNLRGLRRYIDEALRRYVDAIEIAIPDDLRTPDGGERALQRLARQLARLRIPLPAPATIRARIEAYAAAGGFAIDARRRTELDAVLAALCTPPAHAPLELAAVTREVADRLHALDTMFLSLPGVRRQGPEVLANVEPAEIITHVIRQATRIALHARLRARLAAIFEHADASALVGFHATVRGVYKTLFDDQLVVVDDAGETGDQIIDRCARAVPPGTDVSVMGIQNIKGTGLDFVYRWLALDQTRARLDRLASADEDVRIAALRELEAFEDYGLVDAGLAAAMLAPFAAQARDQELLLARRALDRVTAIHEQRRAALSAAGSRSVWSRIATPLEAMLDPIDSMRRRRRAQRVIDDLVAHRISHGRAAKEMRALYDRQGGGWLTRSS
jgi:poly-gamma-glutamate synthase PgsB/CapB